MNLLDELTSILKAGYSLNMRPSEKGLITELYRVSRDNDSVEMFVCSGVGDHIAHSIVDCIKALYVPKK